uniref:Late embryogenesis abundant protein LEA-2 subgroup domain-containing protein n=1 Tax=Aegilops tauschii TaxID=37682 RepID=R7WAD6_AEGTA
MLVVFCAVVVVCALVPIQLLKLNAQYYVAIASVSGPDPTRGLSFNLTLSVASWSYGAKACIKPGTRVEVSHRGVQLAMAGPAEVRQLCAEPRERAEQRMVARVTQVPLGHVLDSLTADMRNNVAVFDVTLHLPAGSYGVQGEYRRYKWRTDCGGMRVGDTAVMCPAPNQDEKMG